jgi:BCD family chlorophyll transporter-like MFS transporter
MVPVRRQLGRLAKLKHQTQAWLNHHRAMRRWLHVLRLGLFQFGMGLSLAPLTGTLNRVLIDEARIPAVAVGFLIAIHYFVSPARALIGFHSDQERARGNWRTPYVVLGAMLTYGGLATAPFSLILLSGNGAIGFWPAMVICTMIFLAYGIGVNIVETIYLALVSDITAPQERGRVLAVLWIMLVLGTIVSSVLVGMFLIDYNPMRLIRVMQGSAVIFVALTFLSLWGQERLRPDGKVASQQDAIRVRLSLGESLRMLAGQKMMRGIFALLFIATTAFATHDVLLEPYGGQVLNMSVAATTRLTAWWGVAMLTAITLAGWLLWRGRSPVLPILLGCASGILGFLIISYASDAALVGPFRAGVWMIGMGRGMFIVGSLALIMTITDRGHAGLFLGLWGVSQALAQGFGTIGGGLVRDIAQYFTGNVVIGYTTVYMASLAGLVVALLLLVSMRLGRQLQAGKVKSPWSGLQDVPADQILF